MWYWLSFHSGRFKGESTLCSPFLELAQIGSQGPKVKSVVILRARY